MDRRCVECGSVFEVPDLGSDAGPFAERVVAMARVCSPCVDRLDVEDRRREEADRLARRRRMWGVPAELAGVRLDRLAGVDPTVFDAAVRWGRGDLRGLVLTGRVGVGKTTLAAGAANRLMRVRGGRWCSVPSLIASAFGDRGAREMVASTLTGHAPIVLDDIDKVKPGDWVASQLFAAIDNRVTAGAGLFVTSNLSPGRIAERFGGEFGDAIASRLAGYCEIYEVVGADRRIAA